jgi:MFS family permease
MTNKDTFFSKNSSEATASYNRWLVVPSALFVHLCIGQVYAFNVFNKPMSMLIGIDHAAPGDWTLPSLGWIFSLAIVFLGLSAAFGGTWLEKVGPRKTMSLSACCFGSGFIFSALGIYWHQLWMIYLGYGVVGGIGLGLGYVSPVATLIRWFPDKRGMATGLAIMGFGGGALIGAPLAVNLMHYFSSTTSNGVYQTFTVMGIVYFLIILLGALTIRIPPEKKQPQNLDQPELKSSTCQIHIRSDVALKTPQFWLMWLVLFCNVTAGIGVLGQASLMIQEVFQNKVTVMGAALFVGGLSLFNMFGRFFWAFASDFLGRKNTYLVFFIFGAFLYVMIPYLGDNGHLILFITCYFIILSMYGGGFSTIPAYLADVFGTHHVGAIHGRLLTAWSVAGIIGPVLVNYIREYQINHGVIKADAYNITMYIMAGLLVIGCIANLLNRPISKTMQLQNIKNK